MEWTRSIAAHQRRFGLLRAIKNVRRNCHYRVQRRVQLFNPIQMGLSYINGRDLFPEYQANQF